MRRGVWIGAAVAALAPVGVAASAAAPAGAAPAAGTVRYVSGSVHGGGDTTCASAGYRTIAAGLAGAPSGTTVVVCPGTYREDVTVAAKVTLTGIGATIDASGKDNGIVVAASGATVEGFTVDNAIGEGILVAGAPGHAVAGVTLEDNRVVGNDLGGSAANHGNYRECQPAGQVPGDCGEGIHLMGAVDATVEGNTVTGNSGGILLSDEVGPTHGNLIEHNVVSDNVDDCGVTLASHNAKAFVAGALRPNMAGVYQNRIVDNVLVGNGTKGAGAGVILGMPAPGTAVYDNTISGNEILGNGQAGITLHSHAPGQYADGNRIVGNLIGTNNVTGDPDFQPADMVTTGILVRSAVSPVAITVSGNVIEGNADGMWVSPNVTVAGVHANRFVSDVTWLHRS